MNVKPGCLGAAEGWDQMQFPLSLLFPKNIVGTGLGVWNRLVNVAITVFVLGIHFFFLKKWVLGHKKRQASRVALAWLGLIVLRTSF